MGNKGWVFGDLTHTHKVTQTGVAPRVMVHGYEVAPESVGQFIGMTDKNGREIYEGDIVVRIVTACGQCPPEILKCPKDTSVCPTREMFRDVVTLDRFRYWTKKEEWGYEGEGLEDPEECEVIGNIYENPELLKENEDYGE